jgi:uncharacterized protein YhhL (DUF1145 family)
MSDGFINKAEVVKLVEYGALLFNLVLVFTRHLNLYTSVMLSIGVVLLVYYLKEIQNLKPDMPGM